jgi:hypothetical protein
VEGSLLLAAYGPLSQSSCFTCTGATTAHGAYLRGRLAVITNFNLIDIHRARSSGTFWRMWTHVQPVSVYSLHRLMQNGPPDLKQTDRFAQDMRCFAFCADTHISVCNIEDQGLLSATLRHGVAIRPQLHKCCSVSGGSVEYSHPTRYPRGPDHRLLQRYPRHAHGGTSDYREAIDAAALPASAIL